MSAALKVGLVGAGGVGVRHAATLAGLDDVRLVAVTDVDGDRAESLAAAHDARVLPGLGDLLAEGGLDAVWLCLPPFAHGDPEQQVLEAGLPFFVEKPLAIDLSTSEQVGAAVAASGLPTATGYHWRGMPGVERAARVLADNPARLAQGSWLDTLPPVAWWAVRASSGGQLVEQATHLVDTMRALIGEPVSVTAVPARIPDRDPDLVDPATAALLTFDTGAVATLAATSRLDRKEWAGLVLVADGVAVEVGEAETVLRWGGDVERVPDGGVAKTRVDAEFCAAVRSGDAGLVRVPYGEALRTHRVGCALAESSLTGRTVELGTARG